MPQENIDFGKYGASGIKGSEAAARQLDNLAGGIQTPAGERRGMLARLNYLTKSGRAKGAARAAGFDVSERTMKKWRDGTSKPSKKSIEKLEGAYKRVRRSNVAKSLTTRLNKGGRGTRVEMHPMNQSQVSRPLQRAISHRNVNVRNWGPIVEAWEAENPQALSDAWQNGVLVELGSDWGSYEYVTNVGFAA
ncbi:transcriptional regulator [Streptomyces sp. NPDC001941]|uniref:transcriptional regulator n=1 Tax=Streptomyces sp. NPDC001941 TaxID=3154659 RepID=UPI00332D1B14